jgi:hypothetical protein
MPRRTVGCARVNFQFQNADSNASDQDLHDLCSASEVGRRAGATILVDALRPEQPSQDRLDRADAIDIVWILTAGDIFWRLVHTRRWSGAHFEPGSPTH